MQVRKDDSVFAQKDGEVRKNFAAMPSECSHG